jgi:hypothetical protein
MNAREHYAAGERALVEANANYESAPGRVQALTAIASAEFAAAQAAAAIAGPHRDPRLDDDEELTKLVRQAGGR